MHWAPRLRARPPAQPRPRAGAPCWPACPAPILMHRLPISRRHFLGSKPITASSRKSRACCPSTPGSHPPCSTRESGEASSRRRAACASRRPPPATASPTASAARRWSAGRSASAGSRGAARLQSLSTTVASNAATSDARSRALTLLQIACRSHIEVAASAAAAPAQQGPTVMAEGARSQTNSVLGERQQPGPRAPAAAPAPTTHTHSLVCRACPSTARGAAPLELAAAAPPPACAPVLTAPRRPPHRAQPSSWAAAPAPGSTPSPRAAPSPRSRSAAPTA